MTKALAFTPKITSAYGIGAKNAKKASDLKTVLSAAVPEKSKQRPLKHIINLVKFITKKISDAPEEAVTKISKGGIFPAHKDPAAIILRTTQG